MFLAACLSNSVAALGEGPPPPPPTHTHTYFWTKLMHESRKKFFWRPPPYLKVWIRDCNLFLSVHPVLYTNQIASLQLSNLSYFLSLNTVLFVWSVIYVYVCVLSFVPAHSRNFFGACSRFMFIQMLK